MVYLNASGLGLGVMLINPCPGEDGRRATDPLARKKKLFCRILWHKAPETKLVYVLFLEHQQLEWDLLGYFKEGRGFFQQSIILLHLPITFYT